MDSPVPAHPAVASDLVMGAMSALRRAFGGLIVIALLSLAGCEAAKVSKADQDRTAVAMAKVEADQARSDEGLAARNAANAHQVIIVDKPAK